MVVDSFTGIANHPLLDSQIYLVAIYESLLIMDWAGFEPASLRSLVQILFCLRLDLNPLSLYASPPNDPIQLSLCYFHYSKRLLIILLMVNLMLVQPISVPT